MRNYVISFLLVSVICFSTNCKSEKRKIKEHNEIVENTINAFEKQLLNQQLDSVFSKYNFNGIIAVYRDSISLYLKTQGYADFNLGTPIDSLTVFGIASNSKQFTAVMILQLMEQGRLSLEDKVSDYLDEFKNPSYKNITIQQLLNHTSGLNYMGGGLLFESGTDFHYSNEAYNMLGKLIEKLSGKSFEENADTLFKQSGLEHTYTNKTFDAVNSAGAWIGNRNKPSKVPNMPDRLSQNGIGNPAGGILSNVVDINHWNQQLFGGKILRPESLEKMTQQTATRMRHFFAKVGYGDGIMMYGEGPLAYFHTGYVKGLPSVNIFYPSTRTSVIILSNYADESKSKKEIFAPHAAVREITDGVQSAVSQIREELMLVEN
ncbi:MAG: serine hydrolase [Weeksellaceae bacterium]|jgi:CubicO group peptidase (beta-lactamase class C family)|nr:serine hydrolase [Weeksellaceae bacterium]